MLERMHDMLADPGALSGDSLDDSAQSHGASTMDSNGDNSGELRSVHSLDSSAVHVRGFRV